MLYIEDIRKGYRVFLNEWKWEYHAILYLGYGVGFEKASELGKTWLNSIRRKYTNVKFAAILFIVNPHGESPHLHILMVSDHRYDKKLTDIKENKLEKLFKGDCKITTYEGWTNKTITKYVTLEKNMPLHKPDKGFIDFYRPTVLDKLKNKNLKKRTIKKSNKIEIPENVLRLRRLFSRDITKEKRLKLKSLKLKI